MRGGIVMVCVLLVVGCVKPPEATEFFTPVSLEVRQTKSRVFETADEIRIMRACSTLLYDHAFQIYEADSRLGWIAASKVRYSPETVPPLVVVSATVLIYPVAGNTGKTMVRFSLHGIDDADIYQKLFLLLGKELFLEAEPI